MATLLQSIETFIQNIEVTDRQEDNIGRSLANITGHLEKPGNKLHIERTFTTGSYERDTIIKPLDDVDLFAVLNREEWEDEYGNLPKPQSVLSRIRDYLIAQHDYKDKVKQDRPCVTIELSDKRFDVLPCFPYAGTGYYIPGHDLQTWDYSDPETLAANLDRAHKACKYKLKSAIKAIKYWNRDHGKMIPSYHIEETMISMFELNPFVNYEEAIRTWFNKAESYLSAGKFKSMQDHQVTIKRIQKVRDKLNMAQEAHTDGNEGEALRIWKDVFQKAFPTVDIAEAKKFAESLSKGGLKVNEMGRLSTVVGSSVPASKGFYGDVS